LDGGTKPTLVFGGVEPDGSVLGAVFQLPETEAGQFDLQPAVHQAGAGLQVTVRLQAALVKELHPLETQTRDLALKHTCATIDI